MNVRRLLCLFGIHFWSVPKVYAKHNVCRFGKKVGEITTMVKGCTVPGCCKLMTFKLVIGEDVD